jgi:hypothetical protein
MVYALSVQAIHREKQMQYLMIQNRGEANTRAYTDLGYSTACDEENSMGMFGTGAKQALTLLLREGLEAWVYCGTTRIQFVADGEEGNSQVLYRVGTGVDKKSGWVLRFGSNDWTNTDMALREFISNAIDRHENELKGSFQAAIDCGDLKVTLVDENQRKAKSGYTRIFVQVNDDVRRYFANLGEMFLHFSDNPHLVDVGMIKRDTRGPARVYRMGAYVCTMHESEGDAIFDYNFQPGQIEIDEARNSNPYTVRAACARLLRDADSRTLAIFLKDTLTEGTSYERKFDNDYILNTWANPSAEQCGEWTAAWKAVAGDSVAVGGSYLKGAVHRRGHEATVVKKPGLTCLLRRFGVKTNDDVLTERESEGIVIQPATYDAKQSVNSAWTFITETVKVDVAKPNVLGFDYEADTVEKDKAAFREKGRLFFRTDLTGNTLMREALRLSIEHAGGENKKEFTLDLLLGRM